MNDMKDQDIVDILEKDAQSGIEEPEPGYWDSFPARVRQRIASRSLERAGRRPWIRRWVLAPLVGALAVAMLVFGAIWINRTPTGEAQITENILPAEEWNETEVEVWEDVFPTELEEELVDLTSDELDAVIVALEDMRRS